MSLITLEHKILIATEVMGWIYNSEWDTFTESIDKSPKSGLLSVHFDPTSLHFYRILGNLDEKTCRKIEHKFREKFIFGHSTSFEYQLSQAVVIEKHIPEIIYFLIEVLEGEL